MEAVRTDDAPPLALYSLFYVNESAEKHVNLRVGRDPLDTYLGCSRLVAASCAAIGVPYAVITNKVDFLTQRAHRLGGGVRFVPGEFRREIPTNATFYSAHYKLDVLRSFGEGAFGQYVGLVDLDVVALKPLKLPFPGDDGLYVYDLTQIELASYGNSMQRSLLQLGSSLPPRWYGGEFIAGGSRMFQRLSRHIDRFWPAYCQNFGSLFHTGDEMVVTPALMSLADESVRLIDAGGRIGDSPPAIARWWSAATIARQASLAQASQASILHLPADKHFLSSAGQQAFSPDRFLKSYARHVAPKIVLRQVAEPLLAARRGSRRHVPRLGIMSPRVRA